MINRRELLAAAAAATLSAQPARRPNILHIMSDQQQWGTIAGRSECRTPNLNRLRKSGYRLGYVGKWHASWVRTPMDFGFHEVAGIFGCSPAALKKLDLNPDRVPEPKNEIRRTATRQMQWPGSQPFTMWGYRQGPEEATPGVVRPARGPRGDAQRGS